MNTSDSTPNPTPRTRAVQAECAKFGPDYALWYGYVCGELEKMECELVAKDREVARLTLENLDHAEDWAMCGIPHDSLLAKSLVLSDENRKLKRALAEHAKGNVTFHGCMAGENSAEELLVARAEVKRLGDEHLKESLRHNETMQKLVEAEAEIKRLKDQIGYIEAGEHPDEQKPRAATWLQERKNWAAEVERLRNALATIRS